MSSSWSNQIILGRFRVDMPIRGAQESYRAWDNLTAQAVRLHLLAELPDDEASHQLETRGLALARFSHPAVNPYLGYFEFSSRGFWVEGLLDGPSLRDVLTSIPGQPLDLSEALIYIKTISAALAALHNAGWAHADLCPENIHISSSGQVSLSGLFAARRLGEIPALASRYTPPDKAISPAFDVYALGLILYEMLAGCLPEALVDLRKMNPQTPEFLARQLPRALDTNQNTRVGSPIEFFLTACLACHVEAANIPASLPLECASASVLETWKYLPALEAPRALILQPPAREQARRPIWLWPLLAICALGLGLAGWQISIWLKPFESAPPPQVVTEIPISLPVSSEIKGVPTLPAVPTLDAPDGLGGKIVFTCTRSELNQLCMVAPTGGEVKHLTAGTAHAYYPNLSPTGNMLLYASNRAGNFNLYLKLLGADILTQLTSDIGEVSSSAFSPDGTQIIFSNSVNGKPFEIWQVSRDGKDAHQLYAGQGDIASAVWAPNGLNIAFAMSSPAAPNAYDVYILDPKTGTVGPVTKGKLPDTGGSVDWSPDGRSLLLFAGPAGNKNIYLFDIVSGHIAQLTNGGNNAAPVFSPDGRWIAFNSQRSGNADIFIMHPDGSDVRQLTYDPEPDWQPRWGR
jgi:serine/threonine protein kinase